MSAVTYYRPGYRKPGLETWLKIPAWRRVIFLSGFFLTLALGAVSAYKSTEIYRSAAKSPNAQTGETYRVLASVGPYAKGYRYLTFKDYAKYDAEKRLYPLPMLPALFVLITSREFWRGIRSQ